MRRSIVYGAVLSVGLLLTGPGRTARADQAPPPSAARAEQEAAIPQTADEHLARARSYDEKAAAYREEAATHRKMLADYDKANGNPALKTKTGQELPWVAKMRKHCESYMREAGRMAAQAERFAEFHRMRAEELRGR